MRLARDATERPEPETPLEQAVDEASKVLDRELTARGLKLTTALLIVKVKHVPGPQDAVTLGLGFDETVDVLVELLAHAQATALALGTTLEIHTLPVGQG